MKKLKTIFLAIGIYVTLVFLFLIIMSNKHYEEALRASSRTDGSDGEIYEVMQSYGFEIDVFEEPSYKERITAYLKYKP
jgi:hypothetical protein